MDYQFTKPGRRDEISLVGSACKDCGQHFFPTRSTCSRCYSQTLDTVELTRLGRVDRFATVRQAPVGYFGTVPYVLGDVTLEDGVNVLCNLSGKPVQGWHVGDLVASYVLRLPLKADGDLTDCFCFKPRSREDTA